MGKTWLDLIKKMPNIKLAVVSNKTLSGQRATVDVLLVGNLSRPSINKIVRSIESEEKREINYVVMSYEDFYYRFSLKDRFVLEILNDDSVVVVDKENLLKGVNNV